MSPFWTRRAVELLPEPVGSRPGGKTINVAPPSGADEIVDSIQVTVSTPPPLTDAERVKLCERHANHLTTVIADLRAENTRLRADLNLARNLAAGPVGCGHETALRRDDHDRAVCQREHVDEIDRLNAQLNRLRALAVARERAPF